MVRTTQREIYQLRTEKAQSLRNLLNWTEPFFSPDGYIYMREPGASSIPPQAWRFGNGLADLVGYASVRVLGLQPKQKKPADKHPVTDYLPIARISADELMLLNPDFVPVRNQQRNLMEIAEPYLTPEAVQQWNAQIRKEDDARNKRGESDQIFPGRAYKMVYPALDSKLRIIF